MVTVNQITWKLKLNENSDWMTVQIERKLKLNKTQIEQKLKSDKNSNWTKTQIEQMFPLNNY